MDDRSRPQTHQVARGQLTASAGRGAAVASAGTAVSRATGLMRLAATTYALGVTESRLADTYNLANTTPTMIHELIIGGVLSSVLMRAYIEVRDTDGQEEAWRFIHRVTNATVLLLAAISLVVVVAAPLIFKLYTLRVSGGAEAAQQMTGTFLLRLFVPQILFYGLSYISTAVLNAHRRFGVPMFAPVLNNLTVTATLLLFAATVPETMRGASSVPTAGALILGIGTSAGVGLQALAPWLYMRRVGYRWRRGDGIIDPRFGRLIRLSAFMAGYVVTNMIGLWVALFLANQVQGGVAAYQYAFVFFQLPHGLLAVSIATAIFPSLTERAVANDLRRFAEELGGGLRAIAFFVLPAIAGYLAIAPSIVSLLLEHGITTEASTDMVSLTLRVWAIGIFFFSTFYLFLRAFYAMGDTRTPMLINLVGFAVNVVLDVTAFAVLDDPRHQIAGLAAGHAASYMVAAALALRSIKGRVGHRVTRGYPATLMKILLASALTGAAAWLVSGFAAEQLELPSTVQQLVQVLAATAAGLLVYAGMAKALRLEEVRWILTIARRRR
ncbi:MAG TPA: murein biosynthesis integral membrane protein MurJ [Actinomycetota bacterium]|nr:murein biosynthesis integral membrane protein MurJ [Actinomycetota bacterium]